MNLQGKHRGLMFPLPNCLIFKEGDLMIELVTKLLVDGVCIGGLIFIAALFTTLLFLLLCKIEDYYEEKRLYRRNHGKRK